MCDSYHSFGVIPIKEIISLAKRADTKNHADTKTLARQCALVIAAHCTGDSCPDYHKELFQRLYEDAYYMQMHTTAPNLSPQNGADANPVH